MKRVKSLGVADEATFLCALLPEDEINGLQQQLAQLGRQKEQAQKLLQQTENLLNAYLAQKPMFLVEGKRELEQMLADYQLQLQSQAQRLGKINQQL